MGSPGETLHYVGDVLAIGSVVVTLALFIYRRYLKVIVDGLNVNLARRAIVGTRMNIEDIERCYKAVPIMIVTMSSLVASVVVYSMLTVAGYFVLLLTYFSACVAAATLDRTAVLVPLLGMMIGMYAAFMVGVRSARMYSITHPPRFISRGLRHIDKLLRSFPAELAELQRDREIVAEILRQQSWNGTSPSVAGDPVPTPNAADPPQA